MPQKKIEDDAIERATKDKPSITPWHLHERTEKLRRNTLLLSSSIFAAWLLDIQVQSFSGISLNNLSKESLFICLFLFNSYITGFFIWNALDESYLKKINDDIDAIPDVMRQTVKDVTKGKTDWIAILTGLENKDTTALDLEGAITGLRKYLTHHAKNYQKRSKARIYYFEIWGTAFYGFLASLTALLIGVYPLLFQSPD